MAHGKTYTIIRIILKILWRLAILAAVLLFAAILLVQTPFIQTWIAGKVTSALAKQDFDADIHIDRIHLSPFNTLVLKGITVIDEAPVTPDPDSVSAVLANKLDRIGWEPVDTLFKAKYVIAKFSLDGLLSAEGVKIKSAYVDDGFFFLVNEDNFYGTNLTRMFRLKPETEKPEPKDVEVFSIKEITLKDFAFYMKSFKEEESDVYHEGGIDWDDLAVTEINFTGGDMRMKGKVMWGMCESISFKEKSGFVCESISGKTRVGNGMTLIEDLHVKDPYTDIYLSSFSMSYDDENDFADFLNKVRLEGNITNGVISFGTLKYFVPELSDNTLALDVKGKVSGPVCDLKVNGLDFKTPDNSFAGKVSGRISGIPDPDMKLEFEIGRLDFTMKSLDSFVAQWVPGQKSIGIGDLAPEMKLKLRGKTRGSLNNLEVDADIQTAYGQIDKEYSGEGSEPEGRT